MTDYPLNMLLVNQDDGNEMVSDVNDGNYVFLHTGIHGYRFKRVKVTIEVTHDNGDIESYWTTLDQDANIVEENSVRESP